MSHARTDPRLSVDSSQEEEGVAASQTADSSVSDFLNTADHGTNAKVAWPSTETHTRLGIHSGYPQSIKW